MKKLLTVAIALCLLPTAVSAQEAPVVPAWNVAGHGNVIETTDLGDGSTAHQARIAIGGGRGGFGRTLSRLSNAAGVGGFALTVRTEAAQDGPRHDVQLSIYLKDVYEYMPSGRYTTLDLGEGVRIELQRDGEIRHYGGEVREADYRGRLPIVDYLAVVARSRIDGSFEGRDFRIEKKPLDALRDVLLRVAAAGGPLTPASSPTGVAAARTGGQPGEAGPGTSVIPTGVLAEHGLRVTSRAAALTTDRTALAQVVDFGEGTAAPVLLQPVLSRWSENDDVADWRPMAAIGDTVHVVHGGAIARAVVNNRYAVEEIEQGSLCRSGEIYYQGWLYEVDLVDGATLARTRLTSSILGALRPAVGSVRFYEHGWQDPAAATTHVTEQQDYAAMQARAFRAVSTRWGAAMRAARGEGGRQFDDERPTRELLAAANLSVILARGAGSEALLLVSASLSDSRHYLVASTQILYVVGADGRIVQEVKEERLPHGTAQPADGGADLLLTRDGVATWNGSDWTFPTRSLPYVGCS